MSALVMVKAKVSHIRIQPAARLLEPVAGAPQLTAAACDLVREIEILDEQAERRLIDIPTERPLTIVVEQRELVTLMTLGACPELLVLGFLLNQRLIDRVAQVESIAVDWPSGTATVRLRSGAQEFAAKTAHRIVTTGCGQGTVFDDLMSQVDAIHLPEPHAARIRQSTLYRLLDVMREQETLHRSAGSVHGCALFHGAEMLVLVEDVSRHNSIDTVVGWMALHGVSGGDKTLYTTGRMTSEMVMKSAQIGVPIIVSRNGVTAMGLDVAGRLGMTLIGRAVKRRFLCYVGAERFDAEAEAHGAS
jgi:FdhD protein